MLKQLTAVAALTALIACDNAPTETTVRDTPESTVASADTVTIANAASVLAGLVNDNPSGNLGNGLRIDGASTRGERLIIRFSLPNVTGNVGGIESQRNRLTFIVGEFLCRTEAFEAFILLGGEIEADLRSRSGSRLISLVIRDCD